MLLLFKKSEIESQIQQWKKVLTSVTEPDIEPLYHQIISYLKQGCTNLTTSAKQLQGANPKELKSTLQKIPLDKVARLTQNYKTASWWESAAHLGLSSLKYGLPLVGVIFAISSFYYCSVAISRLFEEMPVSGLNWKDLFHPQKLIQAAQKNYQNAEELERLGKITSHTKLFIEEFISMTTMSLDVIKDVIMLILDVLSFGTFVWLDIGISMLLLFIQIAADSATLPHYDQVLSIIIDMAKKHIRILTFEEIYSSDLSSKRLQDLDTAKQGLS